MAGYDGTAQQLFLLGAAKSGTTSLATWLDGRPDVLLSRPKEPYFYELFYERGLQDYWNHCFAPQWAGERVVLDARHRNLYLPYVPARIEATAPDPRFVVILREPVSRAFSAWWHWRSRGREPMTFAAAVADDTARIDAGVDFSGDDGPGLWASNYPEPGPDYNGVETLRYRTYVDTGFYAEQLARYVDRFGRDRVLVLFTDDLESDHGATLRRLCEFVGIPADGTAVAPSVENTARRSPTPPPPVAGTSARLRAAARRAAPVQVRHWGRRLARPAEVPVPDERTRALLRDLYRPHNERLAELLERPLPPAWTT